MSTTHIPATLMTQTCSTCNEPTKRIAVAVHDGWETVVRHVSDREHMHVARETYRR